MNIQQTTKEIRNQHYRTGLYVLLGLALLTITEFAASLLGITLVWVFLVIALVKAYLVLREYMHIGRLFKDEE
jgi:hypothetical protein